MTFRNRPGVDIEQRMNELEKEFGLNNIVDIPVDENFPVAGQGKGNFHVVEDSGTVYFVLTVKGKRYRMSFTEF